MFVCSKNMFSFQTFFKTIWYVFLETMITKQIMVDMTVRFEKLQEKCQRLGESLTEVHQALCAFSSEAAELEQWLGEATEAVSEATTVVRIDELCKQRDARKERLETTLKEGRALVSKKDVTDTGTVRDRVKVHLTTF